MADGVEKEIGIIMGVVATNVIADCDNLQHF